MDGNGEGVADDAGWAGYGGWEGRYGARLCCRGVEEGEDVVMNFSSGDFVGFLLIQEGARWLASDVSGVRCEGKAK